MSPNRPQVDLGFLLVMSALFAALFLVNSTLQDSTLTPKWMSLMMCVTVGGGVLAFRERLSFSPLLLGLLAMYLCTLIPGFLQAPDTSESFYHLFRELSWVAFLLVLASTVKGSGNQFLPLLTVALAVVCLWAGVEWLGQLTAGRISHEATYSVTAGFAHRNLLIECMALLLPAAVAMVFRSKGMQRIFSFTILLSATVLLLVLLGRTGWMALLVIILVFGWVEGRKRWRNLRWVYLLPVVAPIVVLFISVDEWYTIYHHFETALDPNEGTTRDRLLLAHRSWMIFQQSIWTGVGWGQWPVEVMPFDQFGMLTESATQFYQWPHNDFLWLLSEGGILPALTYIALLATGAWKAYRQKPGEWRSWLLASYAVYFLISMVGFPQERMEHRLVLALLLAVSFYSPEKRRHVNGKWALIPVLISLCSLFWFSPRLSAERHLALAIEAWEEADWYQMLEETQQINHTLTIDRTSLPVHWYNGLAQSNLGLNEVACQSFELAHNRNPYHPIVLNHLGLCEYRNGNVQQAEALFYRSVRYTTSFSDAWVNLAMLRRKEGNDSLAFELLAHANPKTADLHYDWLAMNLAIKRIDQLIQADHERKLKLTLTAIRNTPHWALDVFKKSVLNCIPFEDQAMIEAFYYMFSYCHGPTDCGEITTLKQRYIPDYPLQMDDGRIE